MKIKKLGLSNFRRFKALDVELHDELTVIVAKNGRGKTSILDAGAIALGTFVSGFEFGIARGIEQSDVRKQWIDELSLQETIYPASIAATFSPPFHNKISILRQLMGPKSRTTVKDAASLAGYAKGLQILDEIAVMFPVVAYYGTGRLWNVHKNMSRKSVIGESRSMGYEDCLSAGSSYKQLQQWMAKATQAVLQQDQKPESYKNSNLRDQVQGIEQAVNDMLENEQWDHFHYSLTHEELVMSHYEHGLLPVSLLSDGVRAVVSLVADLAWRCVKLNPHFGQDAPRKTSGIVFIDEVDMHLHPAWQQKIISGLRTTFPNVQFIVTTHSPQVLSTVSKENIRIIGENIAAELVAAEPRAESYGRSNADVLQGVMHVDPMPTMPETEELDHYRQLVEQGDLNSQSSEIDELKDKLSKTLGADHPELVRIAMVMRRRKALG
ncbi:AAA family ATPase [Buttiauxella sp. S19-1]|uniref:AAA family ATPase n=1 Tax=Buttiauxella sp. S19-1 TaxID=941430 RepID=UPI001EDA8825|nr:AAA family ATPase [Buttiauxella sp. S19-1]